MSLRHHGRQGEGDGGMIPSLRCCSDGACSSVRGRGGGGGGGGGNSGDVGVPAMGGVAAKTGQREGRGIWTVAARLEEGAWFPFDATSPPNNRLSGCSLWWRSGLSQQETRIFRRRAAVASFLSTVHSLTMGDAHKPPASPRSRRIPWPALDVPSPDRVDIAVRALTAGPSSFPPPPPTRLTRLEN